MSQTPSSISSYLKFTVPPFRTPYSSTRTILPAADVTSSALSSSTRLSITAEVRERGGGAVKVYSQVGRVFPRRREGKISEHLETLERRALLTMEWSLRGFKHKKWQDQLRSDCFLPYCSHGASVRRRKRKVGVLWNGLLYKVKP